MDIEPDAIIRVAGDDALAFSDQRRISNETVLGFLNRGLMIQGAVYERYTQALAENLATRGATRPDSASSIRQAFRHLQDPEGCISKESFGLAIKESLRTQNFPDSTGLTALFDILTWHAAFPFSSSPPSGATAASLANEDGFFRAVCLLTRNPPPFAHTAVHRMLSGAWDAHQDDGWLVATRGKNWRDFRRRLFRSLATPAHQSPPPSPTTIPIPRFITYQPRNQDQANSDSPDQQLVIAVHEDERSIDLLDVLSKCPPETDPLTANPLRESYAVIADTFLQQVHNLQELRVPAEKLVGFLQLLLLLPITQEPAGELGALVARLAGNGGDISWDVFDGLLEEYSEPIATLLSSVFSVFMSPMRIR